MTIFSVLTFAEQGKYFLIFLLSGFVVSTRGLNMYVYYQYLSYTLKESSQSVKEGCTTQLLERNFYLM